MDLLKNISLNSRFEPEFRKLAASIPFIKIQSIKLEEGSSSEQPFNPEIIVRLKADEKSWTVIVETKRIGQPREIRAAALQLEKYLSSLKGEQKYGIIFTPYLSEESKAICDASGIGYIDLSGNSKLTFGRVYIETRSERNAFKNAKIAKSIFTPRSQRILRVLLQGPLKNWKVEPLAKEAGVSLGWVSAVRQQLIAHEWAVEEKSGFRIVDPNRVLDKWAEVDDWTSRTETRQYSSIHNDPIEIATRISNSSLVSKCAFTQWFAAWLRHPYTIPPVVTAYVSDWPDELELEKSIKARRVQQGGRIWLVKPRDEGVFNPTQTIEGFNLVSDVQIYIDLNNAPQRGNEQAAELRQQPDFSGGWA